MPELRCYVFLDSLQPQYASFLGTVAQGFLPTPGEASLFVEIAPGMDIMRVTDVALKATNVRPGMLIIERLYGMLEIHSESQADVRAAGLAILDMLGLREDDRIKPELASSQVIRNISPYHTQLIMPGQSLYVMEVAPAGYAALAANEAEKSADIKILEVRAFGSFGRVYLGGEERDIDVAYRAAEQAIAGVTGKPGRAGGG
jgi:ethanolamine utilization microcompartment shell protein EutS